MPGRSVSSALILLRELDPHFLLDIDILLAPNHFHRSFEPGQIRFEIFLVPRKVGVVVIEGIRRRHLAMAPSAGHVILEFAGNLELRFLGQASPEGVFENLLTIPVHVGAGLVRRRPRLQALQALVHVLGPVERREVANDDRPGDVRFFEGQEKRWQGSDIRCVDRELRCVDARLLDVFLQNMRIVFGRIGEPVGRRPR